MEWSQTLTNLNTILAGMIPFKQEALAIVTKAGLRIENIAFSDKPSTNWFFILEQAHRENKIQHLIQVLEETYGENQALSRAKMNVLDGILPAQDSGSQPNWYTSPVDANLFEKIIGRENTLLPIHFLETGLQMARSVARVVTPVGVGTGFLSEDNVLITNHHVIESKKIAKLSHVEFNYQKTAGGLDQKTTEISFDPDKLFFTSVDDDWSAIQLQGNPNKLWGSIALKENTIKVNDRVSIIQHPGGGEKQIALHHNYVRYADDRIVQYLTDTLNGSSGAPVFDRNWNLVALHHAGGYIREPGSKRMVFRNQGIHINRVVEGLQTFGYPEPIV